MSATAIVFPSMIVPRRMLEAARFADFDALVAADAMRAGGDEIVVLDALACAGATATPLDDGQRVTLGVTDAELVARLPDGVSRVFVATSDFHSPAQLAALVAAITARAPAATVEVGLPAAPASRAAAWSLVDVPAYLSLQRAVAALTNGLDAALPIDALDDGAWSVAALDHRLTDARAAGATSVLLTTDLASLDERQLDDALAAFDRHGFAFACDRGPRPAILTESHIERTRSSGAVELCVQPSGGDEAVVAERVALAASKGVALRGTFRVGGASQSERDINAVLEHAMGLFDRVELLPRLVAMPGGLSAEKLEDFLWTFDERVAAGQGPKKVIMNVTYRCNNRCTFCATGTRTQVDGNYERQRELLVKYRDLGVRLLDFDGGEPTLNEKLFELVGFARRLGYEKVNVTTNARMASYPAYAERLVKSGVTSVLVSIHGPDAQTHAQNVGVAEAFDQTCEGARNIVAAAPRHVELGANITLTKSNHKKLEQVAELVLSLGLKWFNLQFLTPFGRATSSVSPDTAEAAKEAMRVIDKYRDRIKFQVINLPFCFMPGYEEFLMGDLLKLERHMLFVNNDEVNLFEYLRERRSKKPVCETCPRSVFCGGFYELEDVPEPTWLVRPEDLVRPIRAEVPAAGATPDRAIT